jgi:hypothetical protein
MKNDDGTIHCVCVAVIMESLLELSLRKVSLKDVPWYLDDHPIVLERKQELVRHAQDIQDIFYKGLYHDRIRRIQQEIHAERREYDQVLPTAAWRAQVEADWHQKDKWWPDWSGDIYSYRLYGMTTKQALREAAQFQRSVEERDTDIRAFFRYIDKNHE